MEDSSAYLKGALADGHIYDLNSRIRIVVRQKNKEWLENIIAPMLREISNKEPKIIKTSDEVFMIYVYIHKNKIEQKILDFLLTPLEKVRFEKLDEEIKFLTGFFDAEGSVYTGKRNSDKRVIIYQKNREVLEYIRDILKRLEIPSKIYGPYKNGNSYIHRLIVFTIKNSNKFLDIIKPLNKTKFNVVGYT
jgi:hypothetical protein